MCVARFAADDVTIEIDGRCRGQCVEFSRLRRQRGGEKCGDEQTDQTMWKLAENKSDEDVIGFVGFSFSRWKVLLGLGAKLIRLVVQCDNLHLLLGRGIAGMACLQ